MAEPVVVIGAGPGGMSCALHLAGAGQRVVVVEMSRQVGGTCLHRGCIPTKTMAWAAKVFHAWQTMAGHGLVAPAEGLSWAALARRVQGVVTTLVRAASRRLERAGVEMVQARARVAGPGKVQVGEAVVEAQAVVVAAGSVESYPPGLEPDGQWVVGPEQLVTSALIPREVLIVGGGVIGCELASILAAVGHRVVVVEMAERLLPLEGLEPGVSRVVARELKKAGVEVVTGGRVEALDRRAQAVRLPGGRVVGAQLVVVATGRRPRGGWGEELVERDSAGGVLTNASMASSLPGVFAVGDVLGPRRPMLAHLAEAEAVAAAEAILGRESRVDYRLVPGVVFSMPEVAWVGMSTAQASAAGLRARAYEIPARAVPRAQSDEQLGGVCVMVLEESTEKILGVQLVCAHASELVLSCAMAVAQGLRAPQLATMIAPHPTWAELITAAARGASS